MLCHTSLFLFSLCPHVTYKTLTSLCSFYKRPRRTSTTFKVAVSHLLSFFTHVEPWKWKPTPPIHLCFTWWHSIQCVRHSGNSVFGTIYKSETLGHLPVIKMQSRIIWIGRDWFYTLGLTALVCQLKFENFKVHWTSVSKYQPCAKKCYKICKAESIWLNLPICHFSRKSIQ